MLTPGCQSDTKPSSIVYTSPDAFANRPAPHALHDVAPVTDHTLVTLVPPALPSSQKEHLRRWRSPQARTRRRRWPLQMCSVSIDGLEAFMLLCTTPLGSNSGNIYLSYAPRMPNHGTLPLTTNDPSQTPSHQRSQNTIPRCTRHTLSILQRPANQTIK